MYDYGTYSERELIKRAKKRDTKAFAALYESVYKDLYRFALYTLKHAQDAEDVVSETVISAFEHIHKLRKEEAFRGWIFKILMNACNKKWAKEQKEAGEELTGQEPQREIDYAGSQDVRAAFAQLSEEERSIVALSVFGGYQSGEIGVLLDLPAGTVRSKRSRALHKMEQMLK